MVDLLDNPVREYAWGSRTAIPELLGRAPSGEPEAELWMGAHPASPSLARRAGRTDSLLSLIESDPVGELGAAVVDRFGPRLPFLLKVIAADAPLSLQAHPNSEQAREGFADEQARGIPLDAPNRNYKDPNHKPELLAALTPMEAYCGFRPPRDSLRLLETLIEAGRSRPLGGQLGPYAAALRARPGRDGLREVVTGVLTLPVRRRRALVDAVAEACVEVGAAEEEFAAELAMAADLAKRYPGDPGVVIALLLNLVRLEPGQAVFLPTGNLHSYLRGTGVEILANSDNVLRGGLTTKHIDVPELLRVLDVTAGPAPVVQPRTVGAELVYEVPVPDFRLSRIEPAGASAIIGDAGPQILLTVDGEVRVADRGGSGVSLPRGAAAWVPSGRQVTIAGTGTVYRATTNLD